MVAPNYDFDQDKLFQEFSDDPCRRYVLEDVHGFAAWLRKRGYIA